MFKFKLSLFFLLFVLCFSIFSHNVSAFGLSCNNPDWNLRGYFTGPDTLEVNQPGNFNVSATWGGAYAIYRLDGWAEYSDGDATYCSANGQPFNCTNSVSKSFSSPGTYTVHLQASAADGNAGQYCDASATVTVTSPAPALGTICVGSHGATGTWTVSGPQGWSGSGTECRDVAVGTYSISGNAVSGYTGPTYNNPLTQSLADGGAISWDISYQPVAVAKYRCSGAGTCIRDDVYGDTTSSSCNNSCVAQQVTNTTNNTNTTNTVNSATGTSACDDAVIKDNQLYVCYFDGIPKHFTSGDPALSQYTEATISSPVGAWAGFDHDWTGVNVDNTGKINDVYGNWRGKINFLPGTYVFHTISAEYVQLEDVGGKGNLINNWTSHYAVQDDSASVHLTGVHNLNLRWAVGSGNYHPRIKFWWDFTPDPVMSGTLTGPVSCTIPNGGSNCNASLDWSITNPVGIPTAITAVGMSDINVSSTLTSPQSGTQSTNVVYPSRTFYLYNNGGNPLTQTIVLATCASGTTWTGTACTSTVPSGTLSVQGCTIAKGASTCPALATWTTQDLIPGANTAVTRNNPDNTVVSNATSGTNVQSIVNFGQSTFFLYHNSLPIAPVVTIDTTCADGLSWNTLTNKCSEVSCPVGQVWDGTKCTYQCPEGKIWNGDSCQNQCPEGQVWNGTKCVVGQQCKDNQRWDGNKCVNICPDGQVFNDVSCVERCSLNQAWNGDKCVDKCPTDQMWTENKCVKLNPDVSVVVTIPTDATIYTGGSATIQWLARGASSCSGSGSPEFGFSDNSRNPNKGGTIQVSPLSNTTYTVTCNGKSASTTVFVKKKPNIIEN